MTKAEVTEVARQHNLASADKPESQEICFVPGGDYKRFIAAYLEEQGEVLPDSSGELVLTTGETIGEHSGIHNFTVGQRKGLGVATGSPLYVIQIKPAGDQAGDQSRAANQVVLGPDERLYSQKLRARDLNWISIESLTAPLRVSVKIRHRHEPAMALLESTVPGEVTATFDQPQRAVTPGQAAVFYDGEVVVGGGWIV
jgi:tRNA-specific 2-thiouridylase